MIGRRRARRAARAALRARIATYRAAMRARLDGDTEVTDADIKAMMRRIIGDADELGVHLEDDLRRRWT